MLEQPFVGNADLYTETCERCRICPGIAASTEKRNQKEKVYQSRTRASYFTKFVSIDPEFDYPQKETYVCEDATKHFLDYVQKVPKETYKKYMKKP